MAPEAVGRAEASTKPFAHFIEANETRVSTQPENTHRPSERSPGHCFSARCFQGSMRCARSAINELPDSRQKLTDKAIPRSPAHVWPFCSPPRFTAVPVTSVRNRLVSHGTSPGPGRAPPLRSAPSSHNVVWAAAHNQFFALIAMPTAAGAGNRGASGESAAVFRRRQPDHTPPPQGIQTALIYPAQTLAANSSVERQITFYAGPKEYRTLALIGAKFKTNARSGDRLRRKYRLFTASADSLRRACCWR